MKKLLLFILLILAIVLSFFVCKSKPAANSDCAPIDLPSQGYPDKYRVIKGNNTPREGVIVSYKDRQIIINNATDPDTKKYLIESLGYKSIKKCACAQEYELLEIPEDLASRLSPDGGDVKDPNKGSSGSTYVSNYILKDPATVEQNEGPITGYSVQIDTTPIEPAIVKVAIVDSGVDTSKFDISKYLFKNPANSVFCNSLDPTDQESEYGVNLFSKNDYRLPGGSTQLGGRTVINMDFFYPQPKDIDGHGSFINMIISGSAQRKNTRIPLQNVYSKNFIEHINVKYARSRDKDCSLFDAICGVHYALEKGAKVINASWRTLGKGDYFLKFLQPTLKKLKEKNAILIVAAGNDYRIDIDGEVKAWPAALSDSRIVAPEYSNHVITVGAWNLESEEITDFTNFGQNTVSIYAPGIDIAIPLKQGFQRLIGQGTSYAAPFVTRNVAVLWGLHPTWTAKEVKESILNSATTKTISFTVKDKDELNRERIQTRTQVIKILDTSLQLH